MGASEGRNTFTLSGMIKSDTFQAEVWYRGNTYMPFGDDLQVVFGRGINVCKHCIYIILPRVMSHN